MNFTDRLYVEIVPLETAHPPTPHPVRHGKFDPDYVYKVLGIYNPSETSECYLMLVNPQREIWFIPQRHTRAYKLIDSDEFFLPKGEAGYSTGFRSSMAGPITTLPRGSNRLP